MLFFEKYILILLYIMKYVLSCPQHFLILLTPHQIFFFIFFLYNEICLKLSTSLSVYYRWIIHVVLLFQEANKPENRKERPWIITMGHRPMYCSNADDPTICTNKDNAVRKGVPFIKAFGLEDLFYKYGVDLQFYAHEHSYERLWPIYDRKV